MKAECAPVLPTCDKRVSHALPAPKAAPTRVRRVLWTACGARNVLDGSAALQDMARPIRILLPAYGAGMSSESSLCTSDGGDPVFREFEFSTFCPWCGTATYMEVPMWKP